MRTILLREFKPALVSLNPSELDELLAVGRGVVEVSSRGHDAFKLRAQSRVGTVLTKSLRLLIRPKVELRNVFFLLGYANNIRWSEGVFPYEEDDLLNAVARWFDREVAAPLGSGWCGPMSNEKRRSSRSGGGSRSTAS